LAGNVNNVIYASKKSETEQKHARYQVAELVSYRIIHKISQFETLSKKATAALYGVCYVCKFVGNVSNVKSAKIINIQE